MLTKSDLADILSDFHGKGGCNGLVGWGGVPGGLEEGDAPVGLALPLVLKLNRVGSQAWQYSPGVLQNGLTISTKY